jgi:hypothetical protein
MYIFSNGYVARYYTKVINSRVIINSYSFGVIYTCLIAYFYILPKNLKPISSSLFFER